MPSTVPPNVLSTVPDTHVLIKKQLNYSNLATTYIISVLAASLAEIVTYPLDLTKTRLQIQGEKANTLGKNVQYRGMLNTAIGVVREEGILKLWTGITPALYRHVIYSGVRIVSYENIRDKLLQNDPERKFPLWKSAATGAASGAFAQFLASPADLVKVQIQMEGKRKLLGLKPRVHSTYHAFAKILRENGIRGLWKGSLPNVHRAALVNLGDLTTYDTAKRIILKNTGLTDNHVTHVLSSACAGLVAATMGTPADVVKTRIMNQPTDKNGRYQNELPKKIKSRGKDAHLNHEELVQLMKWKQCRGKAYPQLNYLVKVNTPRAVMAETKKAFRKLPNLEQAITALSNLKGVGTTMASALLAAAAPETAPFMADECLMAIPEIEGIDYTTKEYLNFVQHIQSTAERLNKESNNGHGTWNPHQVELALWTHFVANELDPDLLNAIPSANGKSSVSHQNGEVKNVSNNENNHSDTESSIGAGKVSGDPPPADISEDTATSFGGEDDSSLPPSEAAPRIEEETNDSLASGTSATNDSTTNDADATDQRQTDEESQDPPPAKKSRIEAGDK